MSKPLEITLRIDGKDRTFHQEFVMLKYKRKALEIELDAQKGDAEATEIESRQLNLIWEVFGKQFTKKQLEEGLNAIDYHDVMYNIIGVALLGYPTKEELEARKEENDLGKLVEKLMKEQAQSQ
ncbi:hypothetical protein M3616_11275 [Bacillus velezensis]|uniref:phage tail assembly chaperone G n=1 Tax=Bacillus amyloliquefaciens group TaxID=1938374 RepID=UPI0006A87702|nr:MULTISPECIES: hypothetical protein [Bacillus amyloliquefaciens group]MCA1231444.1 hypothetical protein [Bacillus velezensis]MCA1309544.1 hypothetical protein [Bacillus velezensis]MCA1329163.1 hypothetical protein [Bacillus velezensis]MCM3276649.1 hypothetical protein [Bacillus velezensis]MCM3349803.1 hypothetical protein [Bacillus velezensis]